MIKVNKKQKDEHGEYFAEVLSLFQKDTPITGYVWIHTKDFMKEVPAFPLGDFYVVSTLLNYYMYERHEVVLC